MHTLIVSSQLLKNTLLQNSLKRNNIKSLLCAPKSLSADWMPQTDAVLIPDEILESEWRGMLPFLNNMSSKLPLIFIGKRAQAYLQNSFLKVYLKQAVFLDDTISVDDLPILVKDLLTKSPIFEQGLSVQIGPFTLDRSQRLASYHEQNSFLTKKEFFLLELLLQNAGHVTSRERIIDYVWDKNSYVAANTIEVYISRLRRKLDFEKDLSLIQTVPSLGYQFKIPSEENLAYK